MAEASRDLPDAISRSAYLRGIPELESGLSASMGGEQEGDAQG